MRRAAPDRPALAGAGPRLAPAQSRRRSCRLRRSELWQRSAAVRLRGRRRPSTGTRAAGGCCATRPSTSGEPVTAVFAVSLGLRQSRNRVAFVDEAEQRVLGRLDARRSAAVTPARSPALGARAARARPGGPASGAGAREGWCAPSPAAGAVLQQQPDRASSSRSTSRSRPASASSASTTPSGAEVQVGIAVPAARRRATRWRSRCSRTCPEGTYSATYRIISADSYPGLGRRGLLDRHAEHGGRSRPLPAQAGTGRAPRPPSGRIAGSATPRSGSPSARCSSSPGRGGPALAGRADGGDEAWPGAPGGVQPALRVADRRRRSSSACSTSLLALPLQAASAAGDVALGRPAATCSDGIVHTRFGSLMIVRAAAWAAARRDPRGRRRAAAACPRCAPATELTGTR